MKKIDEKEAVELKKVYNQYLDKRREKTQFRVEDIFGDIINKSSISREKITKRKNFSTKTI